MSSCVAFCGTRTVALVSRSSILSNSLFLDSRFSLIIPMIFIFVFCWALKAFFMVDASRVSILCLRSFWSFSKRSRKYSMYSSIEPVEHILSVGSSIIDSSDGVSFANGWNARFHS